MQTAVKDVSFSFFKMLSTTKANSRNSSISSTPFAPNLCPSVWHFMVTQSLSGRCPASNVASLMEGLPASETARVPIKTYDYALRRPSHFLLLHSFLLFFLWVFSTTIAVIPHCSWASFSPALLHHLLDSLFWLCLTAWLFSRSNRLVTWENPSSLYGPQLHKKQPLRKCHLVFHISLPLTLSGHLETLRKLAEVITASSVDTVSKRFP